MPKIADALFSIADKCIEFGTPDLYAKYLLEIGDSSKYQLIKKFLAKYFIKRETFTVPGSMECLRKLMIN